MPDPFSVSREFHYREYFRTNFSATFTSVLFTSFNVGDAENDQWQYMIFCFRVPQQRSQKI